jgi:hypothetical protein
MRGGFLSQPGQAGTSQARLRDQEAIEPGLLRRGEQRRQPLKGSRVRLLPGRCHQAFETRNAGPHNLVMPELVTGEL